LFIKDLTIADLGTYYFYVLNSHDMMKAIKFKFTVQENCPDITWPFNVGYEEDVKDDDWIDFSPITLRLNEEWKEPLFTTSYPISTTAHYCYPEISFYDTVPYWVKTIKEDNLTKLVF
jgi:hypothetical protein